MKSKLAELREQITQIKTTIQEIKSGPLTNDEVAAAVRNYVAEQAEDCSLGELVELTQPGGIGMISKFSARRILINLFRDEVIARLTAYLQGVNQSPGLPASKRGKKLEDLGIKLRQLEIAEELEVLKLEDGGEPVERRKDVDGTLLADVWHQHLDASGRLAEDAA